MESAMKFAAHQRGSARTLVMVPGNRHTVVNGTAPAPVGSRPLADGVAPNGIARDLGTELGNGEVRSREVQGVRTIVARAVLAP